MTETNINQLPGVGMFSFPPEDADSPDSLPDSLIDQMQRENPLEMKIARLEAQVESYRAALEQIKQIVPPCFGCMEVGMQVSRVVSQTLHPQSREMADSWE